MEIRICNLWSVLVRNPIVRSDSGWTVRPSFRTQQLNSFLFSSLWEQENLEVKVWIIQYYWQFKRRVHEPAWHAFYRESLTLSSSLALVNSQDRVAPVQLVIWIYEVCWNWLIENRKRVDFIVVQAQKIFNLRLIWSTFDMKYISPVFFRAAP